MAKKKKKTSTNLVSLIKKGVALFASVVTLVFLFLEMLTVKSVTTSSIVGESKSVTTVKTSFSDFLFNEKNELLREELGLTTVILWLVFALVILSVLVLVASFFAKKSVVARAGACVLVVALLMLFVANFEVYTISIGKLVETKTYVTNITALYFVALGLSIAGFGSVMTLKK